MSASRSGWDFANPDWFEKLKVGRSIVPPLPLDERAAARAIAIFNKFRLPDVAGFPTNGEATGDWLRDIVGPVFGSVDDQGIRHVKEILAMVPKKNNKTTGAAHIMLSAMLVDETKNQEYHIYAPTHAIAERAFDQAIGAIRVDPDPMLQKRFHVRYHIKTIEDLATGSKLKIKTFDMKVATGSVPKGALIDELHLLSSVGSARRVIGQIRGGMEPRRDSFLIFITSQSDTPPAGVFRDELTLARRIRDGGVTGDAAILLPLLYEYPEDFQKSETRPWEDENTWSWVLPNLGRSCHIDSLRRNAAVAREKGESEYQRWLSQHLNIEIGTALGGDRWAGSDYWDAQGDKDLALDHLLERSEVVVIGIDGGGIDDLFGLCVMGRCKVTRDRLVWTHAWVQRDLIKKRPEIGARLEDFARDGDLTLCDNVGPDLDDIAQVVKRVYDTGLLPETVLVLTRREFLRRWISWQRLELAILTMRERAL
jgi:phage terminase large subunit-like protein